jgi:hypothetical protein
VDNVGSENATTRTISGLCCFVFMYKWFTFLQPPIASRNELVFIEIVNMCTMRMGDLIAHLIDAFTLSILRMCVRDLSQLVRGALLPGECCFCVFSIYF